MELAGVTVIAGPNRSGKSTIGRVLMTYGTLLRRMDELVRNRKLSLFLDHLGKLLGLSELLRSQLRRAGLLGFHGDNQKVDNIQSLKKPDENALQMKAFDSLAICVMTFARNVPMAELQQNAIFVVVYPTQNYSERFLASLGELAAENGKKQPLWNLDKLQNAGFFRKVYTVTDEEFNQMSILKAG